MRILIAGDSLALPRPHRINNYSFLEIDLAVAYEQTYPALLTKELLTDFQFNPYIEVINKSKRGQTIVGVHTEFVDNLFFHQPEIIIMHVGIVDCWFRDELGGKQHVPIEQFTAYLDKILSYLKLREECRLILVGIAPTSVKMDGRYPGLNKAIMNYNKVLYSKVDYKNVFYIPVEKFVKISDVHHYLLPDDQHLNVVGNHLVAKEVLRIIKGIIFTKQGYLLQSDNDFNKMKRMFYRAYQEYPQNIDTLYNLIVTSYETGDTSLLNEIIKFIIDNKIIDYELEMLINQLSQLNILIKD